MNELIIHTSYAEKTAMFRDGSETLRRMSLSDAVRSIPSMQSVSVGGLSLGEVKKLKKEFPCIYPYDIDRESVPYTDEVVIRKNMRGEVVFVDVDSVKLAKTILDNAAAIQKELPCIAAMWNSVSRKLHIACRCDWSRYSGYKAAWSGISDDLERAVCSVIGKKAAVSFRKNNDRKQSKPTQCIGLANIDGIRLELFDAEPYTCSVAPDISYDEEPNGYDLDLLWDDSESERKWQSYTLSNWVKWCDRKGFSFRTSNKDIAYDRTIEIRDIGFVCSQPVSEFSYWVNDGSLYRLKYLRDGYSRQKHIDGRKRIVDEAAGFYCAVLGLGFTEALYCTAKLYTLVCEPWEAGYVDEKKFIVNKVAYAFSNKDRVPISFYNVRDIVVPNPYVRHRVEGCADIALVGTEQRSVGIAITKQLMIDRMRADIGEYATEESMAARLTDVFGIDVNPCRVRTLARACGLKFKGGRKYTYDYVNAYTADGKRVKILADKVDGVLYFKSKKDLKNNKKL